MTFSQFMYLTKKITITLFGSILIIYLAVILVSHSPNDPGWSHISSNVEAIDNIGAIRGAWLSDLLMTFLGKSSWLLILFVGYEIALQWWNRRSFLPLLRWLGYAFLLFASCSLCTMSSIIGKEVVDIATGDLRIPYSVSQQMLISGGIIGYELAVRLQLLLSNMWTWVFLPLFIMIVSTLVFDIRWLSLFTNLVSLKWLGSGVKEDQNVHVVKKPQPHIEDNYYEKGVSADDYLLDGAKSQDLSAYAVESTFDRNFQVKAHDKQLPLSFDSKKQSKKQRIKQQYEQMQTNSIVANLKETRKAKQKQSDIKVRPEHSEYLGEPAWIEEEHNQQQPDQQLSVQPEYNHFDEEKESSSLLKDFLHKSGLSRNEIENSDTIPSPIEVDKAKHQANKQVVSISNNNPNSHQEDTLDNTQSTPVVQTEDATIEGVTIEKTGKKPSTIISDFAKIYFSKNKKSELSSTEENTSDKTSSAHDTTESNSNSELNFDYFDSSGTAMEEIPKKIHKEHEVDTKLNYDYDSNDNSLSNDTLLTEGNKSVVTEVNIDNGNDSHRDIADYLQADYSSENYSSQSEEVASVNSNSSSPTLHNSLPESLPDISDDSAFVRKSRAFQTAKHRKNLTTLPELKILDLPDPNRKPSYTQFEIEELSELLEIKLQDFNIKAEVMNAIPGPVVTRFEVELAPGVKAAKVVNISRDLARSLSMASLRVVEVIPGKPYIGIEIPNKKREMVRLIELLDTDKYRDPHAQISMAMGKDIGGRAIITDLAKAPHMLVAGTTGSGKSVLVNSMLISMLLKYTPDQLRLILIDPKQLELANYNDIPHLLTPVVTDMTEAAGALSWCVSEMERRYQLMSLLRVRKLKEFNKKVEEAAESGNPIIDPLWRPNDSVSIDKAPKLKPLPMIVIVADEFADMIMQVGKQAEELITRLAQKSRAAGIHLMLATQRPSVDVITGLIKANVPVRAGLRVNSKIDSRTILDQSGAEDMLGNGDMLFLGPGQIEPERVHGAFVSDEEVNRVCEAWRERGAPDYIENFTEEFQLASSDSGNGSSGGTSGEDDKFYNEAVAFVLESGKVSASSIQRKFSIGYNRAARIVDSMEATGIVGPMIRGKREILMK